MVYTVEITLVDGTKHGALFFSEDRARKARNKASKRPDVARAVMLCYGHEFE